MLFHGASAMKLPFGLHFIFFVIVFYGVLRMPVTVISQDASPSPSSFSSSSSTVNGQTVTATNNNGEQTITLPNGYVWMLFAFMCARHPGAG